MGAHSAYARPVSDRRRDRDRPDLRGRPRPAVVRRLHAARRRGGHGGAAPVLRAVPGAGGGARAGLRGRDADLARLAALGAGARLPGRGAGGAQPPRRRSDARAGRWVRTRRGQRVRRAVRRRLSTVRAAERGGGRGLPRRSGRLAGGRGPDHGDHHDLRRGGDRRLPGGRARGAAVRDLVHGRDRRAPAVRPVAGRRDRAGRRRRSARVLHDQLRAPHALRRHPRRGVDGPHPRGTGERLRALARGAGRGDRARRGRSRRPGRPLRGAAPGSQRGRRVLRDRPPARGGDRRPPYLPADAFARAAARDRERPAKPPPAITSANVATPPAISHGSGDGGCA